MRWAIVSTTFRDNPETHTIDIGGHTTLQSARSGATCSRPGGHLRGDQRDERVAMLDPRASYARSKL